MKTFILIFLFAISSLAQPPSQVFSINEYSGGLKLDGDSAALAPNQCLLMQNMELDGQGRLVSRHGWSSWNATSIASTEINQIFFYEPDLTTKRMAIATNGHIYIAPGITEPSPANWSTRRISTTPPATDSLRILAGDSSAYPLTDTLGFKEAWTRLFLQVGDILYLSTNYTPDDTVIRIGNDHDTIFFGPDWTGVMIDTTDYYAIRRYTGTPHLSQYGGRLYFCDSQGFPVVYDDSNYVFLAVIDSGYIDARSATNASVVVANQGLAHIDPGSNRVTCNRDTSIWKPSRGVDVGKSFIYTVKIKDSKYAQPHSFTFESTISTIDSVNGILGLTDAFLPPGEVVGFAGDLSERGYWNQYAVKEVNYSCNLGSGYAIVDRSKNWNDFELGNEFLTSFLSGHYNTNLAASYPIYCGNDSSFTILQAGGGNTGYRYYIFSAMPQNRNDEYEAPHFSQIHFNHQQLFAIVEDSGRVYYSHPSIPNYIRYNYNFDISPPEKTTVLFGLGDDEYIGTVSSIWRLSGQPMLKSSMGDAVFQRISTQGISDIDNVAKATEEYVYFGNKNGIYRFNGAQAQKVSTNIDPVIKRYVNGRMVLGYFPAEQKLFVSFPDSDVTYILDERFGDPPVWYGPWTIGMTCFYAPADTNIFYFGHSNNLGRVFYYPNAVYRDSLPTSGSAPLIDYQSGWQSLDDFWTLKSIGAGAFDIHNLGTATMSLYKDFESTACDTVLADSTKRFGYYKLFDNDCVGEYFKVRISGSAGAKVMIAGQRLFYDVVGTYEK